MEKKEIVLLVVLAVLIGIGVFLYFRKPQAKAKTQPTGATTTTGATPQTLWTETTPEGIVNVVVGINKETGIKTVKTGLLS